MELGLGDKVAFVTGASGGIGQALVRAFAAEGARVAALARRRPTVDDERILPLAGDVRRPADLDAAMREVEAKWGRVDICVANAGIWPAEDLPIDALPEDRIRDVIET